MASPSYRAAPSPTEASAAPDDASTAADQARLAFVRTVSHELRTPLNSIIGFSDLIAREMYGPLEPQYVEAADMVRLSGMKMLRLVNQVLEIARLEAGGADLHMGPEPVDAMLEEAAADLPPDAEARGVRVEVACPSPTPLALADSRAVRTALLNLVQNAAGFSPDGARIRLAASVHGPLVLISVADEGPGLDPAELPRLMQPFQQGENALTRRHPGAGLGWAIVRLLCKAMGGGFNIATAEGQGLTATIALRRAG